MSVSSTSRKGWDFSGPEDCLGFFANKSFPGYCNATWDGFLCWPLTPPGQPAYQSCPENVKGILREKLAYRQCSDKGFWIAQDGREAEDPSWTNFTDCFTTELHKVISDLSNSSDFEMNLKLSVAYQCRILEMVGYSISFAFILASLCILSSFRSLRTKETSIHRQLYLSMLIQVVIRLVVYTDQFLSRGGDSARDSFSTISNHTDFSRNGSADEIVRGIDNTPYLCESFYVLLEYARTAMFHWFFIEGLHLHNVLTIDVFPSNHASVHRLYYAIGWGLPFLMTTAWAVVTGHYLDTACWFGYNHTAFYWIVEGPRLAFIAVNLLFLLNILRVLLTKLRNSNSSVTMKVRKAVRAAIVLQPLLGITNSLQMVAAPYNADAVYFAIWSYGTTVLVSFQGFFAALFYCFLKGEVRTVLSKYCETQRTQRAIERRASTFPGIQHNCNMQNVIKPKRLSPARHPVINSSVRKPILVRWMSSTNHHSNGKNNKDVQGINLGIGNEPNITDNVMDIITAEHLPIVSGKALGTGSECKIKSSPLELESVTHGKFISEVEMLTTNSTENQMNLTADVHGQ